MEDYRKYLDPKTLNKIGHIDIKARLIVEGFLSGAHRSPYHGFSVEFAEHREYVSGDDIRTVAHPVLRHRIITNFSAEAEGITADHIIDRLIESTPARVSEALADGRLPQVLRSENA